MNNFFLQIVGDDRFRIFIFTDGFLRLAMAVSYSGLAGTRFAASLLSLMPFDSTIGCVEVNDGI